MRRSGLASAAFEPDFRAKLVADLVEVAVSSGGDEGGEEDSCVVAGVDES